MSFLSHLFAAKRFEKRDSDVSEGLTSFHAFKANVPKGNTLNHGSEEVCNVNLGDREVFLEEQDEADVLDDMYALGTSLYALDTGTRTSKTGVYAPRTEVYANIAHSLSIVLPSPGVTLSRSFRKLTTIFLGKSNAGVGPVVDRVSVHQDGMRTTFSEADKRYASHLVHDAASLPLLGTVSAQLPGYTLQREVSSDSERISGEQGMKERSIFTILERLRTGRLGKDFWMKDENCLACFICDATFTAWRRRHHCRTCGQIFCSRCTALIPGTSFGHIEHLRVCNRCHKIINEYEGLEVDGEDGKALSERYWLRSISQTPFKSNHFMNVFFPKKQVHDIALSSKNSQYLVHNTLDVIKPTSPISFMSLRTLDVSDSDLYDTSGNFLASSFKSFTTDSIDDKVNGSKQGLASKLKRNHVLNKRNHFVSFEMKSLNDMSMDLRETSNRLTTSFSKTDEDLISHHDSLLLENETSLTTEFEKKKIIKTSGYTRKKGKLNKKYGGPSVLSENTKGIDKSPKNTCSARPYSSISLKVSEKMSLTDISLKAIDANSASLCHIREFLKQLLLDLNVSSVSNWEQVLTPILFKIVENINPNVRNGDDIDIRHYVKIKKILGDPTLSCYVQGLVFTKKLALKKMNTSLVNPRVVLITFPIEYHRAEAHFMSLDPVIAQEKEYLRNLVNRILSLHPTLLFVEKSVSGLAMHYLSESNVVVASNVKPSVIQAISRCTRADIISSIDKLALSPRVGRCAYFNLRTFVNLSIPNSKKTFIFLEGCPKDLGCTIILRGPTFQELSIIKQIMELMVYVVYNLKLEMSFMKDQFVSLSDVSSNQLMVSSLKDLVLTDDDNIFTTSYDAIIKVFETRLLSASPYVRFPPPYMLLKVRDSEKYFNILLNGKRLDILDKKVYNFLKEINASDTDNLLSNVNVEEILKNAEIEKAQQEFKAQEKNWQSYFVQDIGVASPFSHQDFAVLYSTVCTASAIPCKGPGMNIIEYYRETDCTLGQYIEDMCSSVDIICDANLCGKKLFEHHRSYVHDNARITVYIQELSNPIPEIQKTIFVWSNCKICNQSTPMTPMSDNTWKYSFGKYLELLFYNIVLRSKSGTCLHDINKDYIRYFGYQNYAVKFQFDHIELYGLSLPQVEIMWKPEEWIRIKLEEYNSIKLKIEKFCDSVEIRLNGIALDAMPLDKFEVCKFELDRFKKKIKDERVYLLGLLKDSYQNSHPLKILPLNRVLRTIQEMVVQWDFDFNEFDKDFFPSEKDLRRFTSLHLKKLFMDRDVISDQNYSKGLDVSENQNSGIENKLLKRNEDGVLVLKRVASEKGLNFISSSDYKLLLSDKDNTDMNVFNSKKDLLNTSDQGQDMIFSDSVYDKLNDKLDEKYRFSNDINKFNMKIEGYGGTENAKSLDLNRAINSENQVQSDNNNFSDFSEELSLGKAPGLFPSASFRSFSLKNSFFRKNFIKILKLDQKISAYNFKKDNIFQDVSKLKNINLQSVLKTEGNLDTQFKSRISGKYNENNIHSFSNHFDQLNRELENQQTHKQHLQMKKNYAFPPSSSKPIVEIFENVQEAVNETSDDEVFGEQKRIKKRNKDGLSLNVKGKRKMRRSRTMESFNLYRNKIGLENSEKDSDLSSLEILYTSSDCFKFPNDDITDEIPAHGAERISLMKALFAFWVNRASVGWSPLNYPLNSSEHVFTDSDIIVREDEPSSFIAFILSSSDYLDKLNEMQHVKVLRNIYENSNNKQNLNDLKELTKKLLEDALLKPMGTHLKYQFKEGSARLFCKVFYAEQFDAFRRACKCDENYLPSLSRCYKWKSSGGKSGSVFLKTLDDRLVLKQLSRLETEAFIKFAPSYFEYMSQAFFHELPTAMAKIIGFYQIGSRNLHTGKVTKMNVLVTENLFYGRKTSRIFDLKGSMRNRHVQSTGKENEVLLDENLVEFIYDSPLFIREHLKKILRASLWNDTLFLAKMNVMDYSMVVGIDDEKQELIIGIIDCIRTYTWDKKLESWVKEKGLVGGGGKEPTVVTPRQYKNRFREAMDSYIYGSPSCWYLFESALGLKV